MEDRERTQESGGQGVGQAGRKDDQGMDARGAKRVPLPPRHNFLLLCREQQTRRREGGAKKRETHDRVWSS